MSREYELADVIHNFLPSFNKKKKLSTHKLRTLDALTKCRTEYMGGHMEECESCGEIHTAYNSCRNRHCPKCGALDKEKWIIRQEANLLNVKYFHLVFTVPASLNLLFLNNQREMYNLLFHISWDVIKNFGNKKRWIGGKMGASSILHTTGQNLSFHPHLHYIVPAGALMKDNRWKAARNRGKFLFPVKSLSKVFRARFVAALRTLKKEKRISGEIPKTLFDKEWVVFAKRPFGGAKNVLNYLGRYTHRTAISNDRILEVNSKEVTFSWKDYRKKGAKRTTTMLGEDFLGLFVQHILPAGFTRIRHYGFLSSAAKKKALALIRKALKQSLPKSFSDQEIKEKALSRMGIKPNLCKKCGGNMEIIQLIPNQFKRKKERYEHRLIKIFTKSVEP